MSALPAVLPAPALPTDWPGRAHSRLVDAGGLRWHVQVSGHGPTVLLLHGTGAAGHSWRELGLRLAHAATVVVPDLPGHGFSQALRPATMGAMARALAALLRALALPPARWVIGHSAGAALGARLVLDGHAAPEALLAVNGALQPFDGLPGLLFPPLARWLAGGAVLPRLVAWRATDPAAVRRLVAATGSRLDDEGLALYRRLMREPAHVAGALAMMADWDLPALWHALPRLACPLGLIVGERDGTVPPAQAAAVAARVPGAQVLRLAGLGHLAHEEAPQRVAEAITALAATLARGASAERNAALACEP